MIHGWQGMTEAGAACSPASRWGAEGWMHCPEICTDWAMTPEPTFATVLT